MILYFADRQLNILGQASTNLPKGITATNDLKTEDVETGVAIFECDILFDKKTRLQAEAFTEVGNYILRSHEDENEFYSILDCEIDTKKQKIYIYAEDAGLDLINEIVGSYEADQYYPISHYVNMYANGSGWEIGINEVEGLTRQLSFDSEETTSARLLNIAKQFNKCELSFSFKISGLQVVKKYINIYEKRGTDTGIPLRLNKEIDSIFTTKSISNLATALKATGGTPDDAEDAITLLGYEYDDGDFYVDGEVLKSRTAFEKWKRLLKGNQDGGHIVKTYSDNSLNQAILCENAIKELKLIRDMEVNYEVDIKKFPKNVKPGDRVNIVDDAGNLYLSSRLLVIETSVVDRTRRAVIGEHLIKKDGISEKIEKLAAEFDKTTTIVDKAKDVAKNAIEKVLEALKKAENAESVAGGASDTAQRAEEAAKDAAAKALAAEAAVGKVETSVQEIKTTVENAKEAAENAHAAAETATQKAEEAKTAASNAVEDATTAKEKAEAAKEAADKATPIAEEAINTANTAKDTANQATITARAAKIDAEQAEKDIEALGDTLETEVKEAQAKYARKTDLTETEAELNTKISQNAAKIESAAHSVVRIDETTNNAFGLAQQAQAEAVAAQTLADEASAYAEEAQTAATEAAQAATDAQNEADTAKAAAATAREVADNAKAELEAAKAELDTVASRADATEEEINEAWEAVNDAWEAAEQAKGQALLLEQEAIDKQAEADKANAKADAAAIKATTATEKANTAKANANTAKTNAENAQTAAEKTKQEAIAAQEAAIEANAVALAAQEAADQAVIDADEALEKADNLLVAADAVALDLEAAERTLAEVLADADATEEEISEAQSAVETARQKAAEAETAATDAQNAADAAAAYVETAQAAAETARAEADAAQAAADEAMQAVEEALGEVGKLEVKTIVSDTKITQTAAAIKLAAKKLEETVDLSGYYTKTETDAQIAVKGDEINSRVTELKTTVDGNETRITTAESDITQLANIIANLVTDGSGTSLMTQTADGWTFSTADIQKSIGDTSEALGDLIEDCESTDEVVAALQTAVNDIGEKAEYITITTHTYTDDSGTEQTEPCIQLGETDSDYKLLITNTQILFQIGSATPTRIKTDGLVTENITVENELRQSNIEADGYFVWSVRTNGNYGLQWKGAD